LAQGYTLPAMEIAITLPKDLVQLAEESARQRGVSLSEFCSQVLSRSLRLETTPKEAAEIARNLNEVYSRIDSSLDPVVMRMQLTALDEELFMPRSGALKG
jgi:hypothetical protein